MNANDKKTITNNLKTLIAKREKMINDYYKMLRDPKYSRIIEMENKRQQNEKTLNEWNTMINGKKREIETLQKKINQRKPILNPGGYIQKEITFNPNPAPNNHPNQPIQMLNPVQSQFLPKMVHIEESSGYKSYNPIRPEIIQNTSSQPMAPINPNYMNQSFNPTINNPINPQIIPNNGPITPVINPNIQPMGSLVNNPINPVIINSGMNPSIINPNPGIINPIAPNINSSNVINPNPIVGQTISPNVIAPNIISPNVISPTINGQINPINPNITSSTNPISPSINGQMNPINPTIINSHINSSNTSNISQSQTMKQSTIPRPSFVPKPKPVEPTMLEKSMKILETYFSSQFVFNHTQSYQTLDMSLLNHYQYDENVILLETVEGKMVGIFCGAYFVFIDTVNESLQYALSTKGQPLPKYEPYECQADYMVINNSFFLMPTSFQINNVQNDLEIQDGVDVIELFTTQQGSVINVNIKQFHFIQAISRN